jgi:MYXO-CTERM domain-containing protein
MLSRNVYAAAPALAVVLAAACSSEAPSTPDVTGTRRAELAAEAPLPYYATPPRLPDGTIAPRRGVNRSPSLPTPGAPVQKLTYWGGRVLSNVHVLAVNWGPNVNATLKNGIGGFYTAITNSVYLDWLAEYDTFGLNGQDGAPGSGQRIGRGTYGGSFTITPSVTATSITNDQVGAELAKQLAAGSLPAPVTDAAGNVNSIYMIDFPPGVSISLGTDTSCSTFGAYHYTIVYAGKSVPYGVHPDCGYSFTASTAVHSHELIEAVTDMEVGLVPASVPTIARPSAWYWYATTSQQGEIGDICESSASPDTTVAGYTVQKEWSNSQGACIGTSPTIVCDGSTPAIPGCRACTAADNGVACNGARPFCETTATNHKFGQCVACTSTNACAGGVTCIQSNDDLDDSCAPTACTTNANCSGNTPVCDTGTLKCRACTANADCAAPTPVCMTTAGNPKKGACVACVADTDCTAPTPRCDTTANVCVAAGPPDGGTHPGGDAGSDGGTTPANDSGVSPVPVDSGSGNPGPVLADDAGNGATPDGGTSTTSGCSASPARASTSSAFAFGLLGLAVFARRRRRAPR